MKGGDTFAHGETFHPGPKGVHRACYVIARVEWIFTALCIFPIFRIRARDDDFDQDLAFGGFWDWGVDDLGFGALADDNFLHLGVGMGNSLQLIVGFMC